MIEIKEKETEKVLLKVDTLRGADLRGVDLREADLREADLRGVDLRGVKGTFTFNWDVKLRVVNK